MELDRAQEIRLLKRLSVFTIAVRLWESHACALMTVCDVSDVVMGSLFYVSTSAVVYY